MYPLFETLCIQNGAVQHAEWHEWRYASSCREYLGKPLPCSLLQDIRIPTACRDGKFRMRIGYDGISKSVEFFRYNFTEIRTLRLVEDNSIDYSYKYSDRVHLERLLMMKDGCDDILIIKNGMVTDTSFCNIVFFDGTHWVTPATPLLKGTTRERLLADGVIREQEVKPSELLRFKSFRLINAMRDFDSSAGSEVKNILWQG